MYSRLVCFDFGEREVYLDVADVRSFVFRKNSGIAMWTVSLRIVPDYSYSCSFREEKEARAFLDTLIGFKFGGTEKNVARFQVNSPSRTARSISPEVGAAYRDNPLPEERSSDSDTAGDVSYYTDGGAVH